MRTSSFHIKPIHILIAALVFNVAIINAAPISSLADVTTKKEADLANVGVSPNSKSPNVDANVDVCDVQDYSAGIVKSGCGGGKKVSPVATSYVNSIPGNGNVDGSIPSSGNDGIPSSPTKATSTDPQSFAHGSGITSSVNVHGDNPPTDATGQVPANGQKSIAVNDIAVNKAQPVTQSPRVTISKDSGDDDTAKKLNDGDAAKKLNDDDTAKKLNDVNSKAPSTMPSLQAAALPSSNDASTPLQGQGASDPTRNAATATPHKLATINVPADGDSSLSHGSNSPTGNENIASILIGGNGDSPSQAATSSAPHNAVVSPSTGGDDGNSHPSMHDKHPKAGKHPKSSKSGKHPSRKGKHGHAAEGKHSSEYHHDAGKATTGGKPATTGGKPATFKASPPVNDGNDAASTSTGNASGNTFIDCSNHGLLGGDGVVKINSCNGANGGNGGNGNVSNKFLRREQAEKHPKANGHAHPKANNGHAHPKAAGSHPVESKSGKLVQRSQTESSGKHPNANGHAHPTANGHAHPNANGHAHPKATDSSMGSKIVQRSAAADKHPKANGHGHPKANGHAHPKATDGSSSMGGKLVQRSSTADKHPKANEHAHPSTGGDHAHPSTKGHAHPSTGNHPSTSDRHPKQKILARHAGSPSSQSPTAKSYLKSDQNMANGEEDQVNNDANDERNRANQANDDESRVDDDEQDLQRRQEAAEDGQEQEAPEDGDDGSEAMPDSEEMPSMPSEEATERAIVEGLSYLIDLSRRRLA